MWPDSLFRKIGFDVNETLVGSAECAQNGNQYFSVTLVLDILSPDDSILQSLSALLIRIRHGVPGIVGFIIFCDPAKNFA